MNVRLLIVRLYAAFLDVLYHQGAWAYDAVAWLVSLGHWGRWRRVALRYLDQGPVLELGIGPGHLLKEAAERGIEMVGLDASPQMVARSHARIMAARHRYRALPAVVLGRGECLPFHERGFTRVVATLPAPYVLDPETLAECRRVLTEPGGQLVLVGMWVTTRIPLLRAIPVFFGEPTQARLDAIARRLADAGFHAQFHAVQDGAFTVGVVLARLQADDVKRLGNVR